MCNLNILLKNTSKLKKEHSIKAAGFMQTVCSLSYEGNGDGDGIYLSSGKLIKSTKKINLINYIEDVGKSNYLIGHQRLATSGVLEDNVQPFHVGDFVFVHNGVVSRYSKGKAMSDTYWMFKAVMDHFNTNMQHKASREKRITSALKCVFNDIKNEGSYSIAMFDITTNIMYYFKNYSRVITMYKSKNYTYLTTKKSNTGYLYLLNEKFEEEDIISNNLYRFKVGKTGIKSKVLDSIGSFSTKKGDKKLAKRKARSKSTSLVAPFDFKKGSIVDNAEALEEIVTSGYYNTPLDERVEFEYSGGICSICRAESVWVDPLISDFVCIDCIDEYMHDVSSARYGKKWSKEQSDDMFDRLGIWY